MIYILIISTVIFVGVVFYLAQLVVLGLEQRADEDVIGPRMLLARSSSRKTRLRRRKQSLSGRPCRYSPFMI